MCSLGLCRAVAGKWEEEVVEGQDLKGFPVAAVLLLISLYWSDWMPRAHGPQVMGLLPNTPCGNVPSLPAWHTCMERQGKELCLTFLIRVGTSLSL